MASYNETDPCPFDLDKSTPTEGATPPSEVNNAIREIKLAFKNVHAIKTVTAATTLTESDNVAICSSSGPFTLKLPAIANICNATMTKPYEVYNIGSATVTVSGNAATINDATQMTLVQKYSGHRYMPDGTQWTAQGKVLDTPTLRQPTIADFTNANHTHNAASEGGQLSGNVGSISASEITVDGTIAASNIVSPSITVDGTVAASNVAIDSAFSLDILSERTAGTGVTIDGLKIKDNAIDHTSWPSFGANMGISDQSIGTTTATKAQFSVEVFDTNGDYDHTTNYRFTPTVAGKYLISSFLKISLCDTGIFVIYIYKNGVVYSQKQDNSALAIRCLDITSIVDFNGTTDYVEIYVASSTDTAYQIDGGVSLSGFISSRIA